MYLKTKQKQTEYLEFLKKKNVIAIQNFKARPKINTTVTIIKKTNYIKPKVKRTSKAAPSAPPPPPPPHIKITCTDGEDEEEDEEEHEETRNDQSNPMITPTKLETASPPPAVVAAAFATGAQRTNTIRRHRRSRRCSSSNDYNNNENYSVDELQVDDETDDEDEPRKPIPKWAQTDMVMRCAKYQACAHIDYTRLFRASADTRIQLEKVFPVVKKTFHVRSSSAEWVSPSVWRREHSSAN